MGTYLSVPIVEKCIEEGEDLDCTSCPLAWGIVDMQGWRKSMEDAHIAQTDISPPPWLASYKGLTSPAKLFAVFDGHGGAEVARFCQLYLIDVLTHDRSWNAKKANVGEALATSFHALDRLIDLPDRREEINNLRLHKPRTTDRRSVRAPNGTKTSGGGVEDEKKLEEARKDSKEGDSEDVNGKNGEDGNGEKLDGQGGNLKLFKKLLSINHQGTELDSNINYGNTIKKGNIKATKMMNGRQVCNLPEHPIHAGCTAVCAVIVGNILTVANAGDSRVVMCRANGVTEAMSFDHKPSHDIEMKRITAAGGFVNQFGRVNGNLNLSRSIGDLKYKQVPKIPVKDQMITAQPDIKATVLKPTDEFIILACDGIWDCLTNEEAVKYVRDRIDTKTPAEIGTEMLDEIISNDPRETQGIGGDNMTVMVVDLKPGARSYRLKSAE